MSAKKKVALLMSLVGTSGAYAGIAVSHTQEAPKPETVAPEAAGKPVALSSGLMDSMSTIIRTPLAN